MAKLHLSILGLFKLQGDLDFEIFGSVKATLVIPEAVQSGLVSYGVGQATLVDPGAFKVGQDGVRVYE